MAQGGEASKNPKLLGCVENELGLREFLESKGHRLIVTHDKEGDGCTADKHLPEADVVRQHSCEPGCMSWSVCNFARLPMPFV